MEEAISHSPEKEQGELLTIVGYSEVVEPCMFGKGMYLYLYFFLNEIDIYTDMSED